MKISHPVSTPAKSYFLSHIQEQNQNTGMRLLALAFDLIVIVLLLAVTVLLVFGQTWLLYHKVYTHADFYLLAVSVPLVYLGVFRSVLGATPGRLLLAQWL